MSALPPNSNTVTSTAASTIGSKLSPSRALEQISISLGAGIFRRGADEFIRFPLKPLVPAILATGMIIYQRGDERKKGHDPNPKSFQIVSDLAIASILVLKAATLYPVLAFLKTLFDMGLQNDAMDKYKSVVQNAGIFLTAFAGILGGSIWAEGRNQGDDRNLSRAVHHRSVQDWINTNIGSGTADGELARRLRLMQQQVEQIRGREYRANRSLYRGFRNTNVMPIVQDTWSVLTHPQLAGKFSGPGKPFDILVKEIEHYRDPYVKAARFINPPVAGLLITTFIGVPIIRRVNRWLEKHHPELRGQHVEYFRFPELANRAGNYHGPGNAHALERGEGGASHSGANGHDGGGEGHDSGHGSSHGFSFPNLDIPGIGSIM